MDEARIQFSLFEAKTRMPESSNYGILTSAISDVGYWRWWSESLPNLFQLEFGGVQIYAPPPDKTKRPSSLLALRFLRPSSVSFIRRECATSSLPPDWPRQLKEETIESLSISHELFALGDDALFSEVVGHAASEQIYFTDNSVRPNVKMAFWAGEAGMRIEAAEFRLVLTTGEASLSTIELMHRDWWSYWREYWNRRDTPDALPKDFACEVTIPVKEGD